MKVDELKNWVKKARCLGDLHDEDVLPAVNAATNYCWSLYDQSGRQRNDLAQLGIKWLSALMVSSVKNGSDPLSVLTASAQIRRASIFREAMMRNSGVLQELLREAAAVPDRLSDSAMIATGILWRVDPTGLGKGCGKIRK